MLSFNQMMIYLFLSSCQIISALFWHLSLNLLPLQYSELFPSLLNFSSLSRKKKKKKKSYLPYCGLKNKQNYLLNSSFVFPSTFYVCLLPAALLELISSLKYVKLLKG